MKLDETGRMLAAEIENDMIYRPEEVAHRMAGMQRTLEDLELRLSAWRDNAHLMLMQSTTSEEARWRNERDNYDLLIRKIREAINA